MEREEIKTIVVGKIMAADTYDGRVDYFKRILSRVPEFADAMDSIQLYCDPDNTLPVFQVGIYVDDVEDFIMNLGRHVKGTTGVLYLKVVGPLYDMTLVGMDDDWQIIDNSDFVSPDYALMLSKHNDNIMASTDDGEETSDVWTMISKICFEKE